MKEIKLSQGQVAQVDDADYEWLSRFKWSAKWDKHTCSFYAMRQESLGIVDGKQKRRLVYMAREILGLKHRDPRQGEHREPLHTLNNQRSNLRIASGAQNNANHRRPRNNRSGIKGVSWNRQRCAWYAAIRVQGRKIHLGTFPPEQLAEAAEAYRVAAEHHYGEFARVA